MTDANLKENFETREFQAEVKQLLDIVVNSLYTEREIFLRELISNSVDALEKFRYQSVISSDLADKDALPLEISIEVDENNKTVTVADTGIGMTRDELVENLGTIAHSGSKEFIRQLKESEQKDLNLIGQFGVGFYSAFMVAKKIRVLTRSYRPGEPGYEWVSSGIGSYDLGPAADLRRGTRIILELKEDAADFTKPDRIKELIRQYSGFVPFPIKVNGEQVNTVQAIWARNKSEVTAEEYNEFYKFIANAFDEPLYQLHFSADAPLAINSLLFVPKHNYERYGFGRMEPGVNLYSRKVLIQQQSDNILPEWLRFVKGVVDSEDIPLNISRETTQDSALMNKLQKVITGRFLKFLNKQSQEDPAKYAEFWNTFGMFLKEGATTDFAYRDELAKLLRFESSGAEPGQLVALADYAGRMKEGQKDIYFINGPSREVIEAGPYLEVFRSCGYEVIYTYEPIDDFVLSNLREYEGKKLVSADSANLELPGLADQPGEEALDSAKTEALTAWLKEILGDKVSEVRSSARLVESPAIMLNLDGVLTSSMQRVMQAAHKDFGALGRKALEINPRHKLVKRLSTLREEDPEFARVVAEQIFDNALIAAGLVVNPRAMVDRIYRILEKAL
ncbi:molecular chaperone HtpG [Pelotomaculum propionicicum]|uniref:Chaperone protein HtpG n=1 Tax=Pelotomaculum propionicicum TaxID=258475 RepID=A0A4Y7RWA8_9FIRM|nr:molecular chaperone HtpG [Pelotomaculum propionicicum]TEB13006.1 Chaperone protein HtpG [Pelotomaculum propionicicum]